MLLGKIIIGRKLTRKNNAQIHTFSIQAITVIYLQEMIHETNTREKKIGVISFLLFESIKRRPHVMAHFVKINVDLKINVVLIMVNYGYTECEKAKKNVLVSRSLHVLPLHVWVSL